MPLGKAVVLDVEAEEWEAEVRNLAVNGGRPKSSDSLIGLEE